MTKIKTLGATVLLVAAVAAPVSAQDRGGVGGRYGWEPSSSFNSEMPGMNSVMRNSESSGMGDLTGLIERFATFLGGAAWADDLRNWA